MRTNNLFMGILSMISLMFSKIESVFFTRNTLMSKQAVDLLNDPTTREEFIEFTTGINSQGKRSENSDSIKVEKTFTRQNGEKITLVKFS
ncbi:MAG: hypothetical protein ACLGH8_06780 [Bacteroidia bacterium]